MMGVSLVRRGYLEGHARRSDSGHLHLSRNYRPNRPNDAHVMTRRKEAQVA